MHSLETILNYGCFELNNAHYLFSNKQLFEKLALKLTHWNDLYNITNLWFIIVMTTWQEKYSQVLFIRNVNFLTS